MINIKIISINVDNIFNTLNFRGYINYSEFNLRIKFKCRIWNINIIFMLYKNFKYIK